MAPGLGRRCSDGLEIPGGLVPARVQKIQCFSQIFLFVFEIPGPRTISNLFISYDIKNKYGT